MSERELLFHDLRRSFKSALVTSLPDDLQEWLRSEAIQLQTRADEIVVDVLRRHRDATELWLSGGESARPITTAPAANTSAAVVLPARPEVCGNCQANDDSIYWNVTGGWSCRSCGASDHPEAAE